METWLVAPAGWRGIDLILSRLGVGHRAQDEELRWFPSAKASPWLEQISLRVNLLDMTADPKG